MSSHGCSIERFRGKLRLRFRADGRHCARELGCEDTPDNRAAVDRLAALVGAALRAGRSVAEIDAILDRTRVADSAAARPLPAPARSASGGPTVASYFESWIQSRQAVARRSSVLDYTRHFRRYILPSLGSVALADLRAADIRGLQGELLAQPARHGGTLSTKTVRNIINGSLKAMLADAVADELLTRDVFRRLKWPAWSPPEPDPFTAAERTRILDWFAARRYRFHAGGGRSVLRPHPPYHVFVHLLFWTGMRPSEATGLQWGDIDLEGGRLQVRRSRHLGQYGEPKTRAARRTGELFPETVRLRASLQPLRTTPTEPVFRNTVGSVLDQQAFDYSWSACLRALGLRQRGIYCAKDTFVTTALQVNARVPWLEQQTGVAYATLRLHYGKWLTPEHASQLRRFERVEQSLFGPAYVPQDSRPEGQRAPSARKVVGNEMVPRGFEPAASCEIPKESVSSVRAKRRR